MNCSICVERFNRSNHAPITCVGCPAVVCASCTETYLLMTNENAHCMNCRIGWTRETLDSCGLTVKFVRTTYKKRREDVLFERERGLMPATQPHVEKRVAISNYTRQIVEVARLMAPISYNIMENRNRTPQEIAEIIGTDSYHECIMWRISKNYEYLKESAVLKNERDRLEALVTYLKTSEVDVKKEAKKFVRACPANGCKGFLSHMWKCGVCSIWTCPECHEVKGPEKDTEHVCNPDNIETAKLLARDTKPCPKCASMIFKIEGCDQMWCPQCATAFSWRKGTIELGRIHNPHYYEYRRVNGTLPREIGDIPCGGMPTADQVIDHTVKIGHKWYNSNIVLTIIRTHHHIAQVIIPVYTRRHDDNLDLRITYMMNQMSEDKFKSKIQSREKAIEKKTEILNILNTYQVVTSEIMQRVVTSATIDKFEETYQEFNNIRLYINELMLSVSARYSCVTPRITEAFTTISLK